LDYSSSSALDGTQPNGIPGFTEASNDDQVLNPVSTRSATTPTAVSVYAIERSTDCLRVGLETYSHRRDWRIPPISRRMVAGLIQVSGWRQVGVGNYFQFYLPGYHLAANYDQKTIDCL
jgi:hypothetical protein